MFGFLIGTLSLIGLVKVIRHGRGGWGHRGGPRRWMFRRLFQRLDTTPGQEKVILEAAENLETNGRAVRDAFFNSRADFARAMNAEHFDTASVNESFEKQQAVLDGMKKAVLENLQKVHEALNPDQRRIAGELLQYGPRALHGGCGGGFLGGGCGSRHGGGYGRNVSQSGAVNL